MQDELNYKKLSDADLIRRFCNDSPDQEAFTELWKRYEPTIRSYARVVGQMCPTFYSQDIFVEDVFDQTQVNVAKGIKAFDGRAKLSTWLYKIVMNAAISHLRYVTKDRRTKEERDKDDRDGVNKTPIVDVVSATDDELTDTSVLSREKVKHDALRGALSRELWAIVKRVLSEYVQTERGFSSYEVVRLSVVEGYSMAEIARIKRTYDNDIRRMCVHDYEALRTNFKPTEIQALLAALER